MRREARVVAGLMIAGAVALAVVTLGAAAVPPLAQSAPPAASVDAVSAVGPALVTQYCVTCHNDRAKTGGLSLEHVDFANVGPDAQVWERVIRKLQSGQMPPLGRPRPDAAAVKRFTASFEAALDRAAAAAPNPGRSITHRLTRTEYANAVRDLLALDDDVRNLLPADDTDQHGFDNNAEVLSISPALLERYLSAARSVSRLAVGRPPSVASVHIYEIPDRLVQDERISERLPFGSRGGTVISHYFPVDGEYAMTLRLQTTLYHAVRGLADPHTLDVRLDRQRIKTFTVGGKAVKPPPASFAGTLTWNPEWESYANNADQGLEVRFAAKAGMHAVGVSFVKQAWEPEDVAQPPRTGWGFGTDEMFDASPGLASVTIEGPFGSDGPGDTASRRRIFTCRPRQERDEERCARTILTTLARRAYRRPVTDADERTLLTFYERGRGNGSFDAGIEAALQRILISPDFLFRLEIDSPGATPGSSYRISDLELASRLSFFLWSSIPDDELLTAAAGGGLGKPLVLERQVRRMLADARSKALVENFAAEWLQLRDLRNAVPDPDLFPQFDENLRDAFRRETELFIADQIHDDHGIADLISANYTFVNERLARHYGIRDVYGSRFRRVELTDGQRGGLLGQGSILTITSYPNRTSPVLRGKWLLENILGTPPPPPPPDVPALKDKGADGQRQSVRERLEAHRQNPACATCHSQMDPLGFALDHFDAVGAWRTHDDGRTPVDASGALPAGDRFEGLPGLRALLLARREQFVGTVAERLLAFAVGRGIEYYDRPAVRAILRESATNDYRWSAIILGIVKSTPFQMRRAES
jgi:mono/diheme cytochrome c family protein